MDKILVLDFGGQYDQLIARKVREMHVYAEIRAYESLCCADIAAEGYKGIIFTGGPDSVYKEDAPSFDRKIFSLGIPILGICYGAQLIAYLLDGKVIGAQDFHEFGRTDLSVEENVLFQDVPAQSVCWMSHSDYVTELPKGFHNIAHTDRCPHAAFADSDRKIYAVQFHPEVTHTEYGRTILQHFVIDVCECRQDWIMDDFITASIDKYRHELKGKKVIMALSGGVDSTVAAVLLDKAIGDDLHCIFVDHGLLRKDEAALVEEVIRNRLDLNLIKVDARERFLNKLSGVVEPEQKRKIIGEEFIRVFEEEANKLGDISILAQGTIYPDVVESGKKGSALIKSHHNVGGLPERMRFEKIVEPLNDLFKDEVREVGRKLGIPAELTDRQPFPGPGLGVRVTGEITAEKLHILQEADAIFREEIQRSGNASLADQYFAVLTDLKAVGVKGDARTYGYVLALRSVTTDDFMTAEWTRLPYDLLETVSNRIINEINEIARVVYDITSKPPGTVEWE